MGHSPSPLGAAATALLHNTDPDACLLELVHAAPHDVAAPLWAEIKAAFAGELE